MDGRTNIAKSLLTSFPLGSRVVLKAVEGPGVLVERLYEMGFLPGESVWLKGRAPLRGPWIVEVRGATIALRAREAECLWA